MQRTIVIYGDRRTGRAIADGMESADLKRARKEVDFWRMSSASYKALYARKSAECKRQNMRVIRARRQRYERMHAMFWPVYWLADRIAILCYIIDQVHKARTEG